MGANDSNEKIMAALKLPEQAIELSFHPDRDVIATGLVNGRVCL